MDDNKKTAKEADMKSKQIFLWAVALAIPLMLTACGSDGSGGGDGSGDSLDTTYNGTTEEPTIDDSNAEDASGAVLGGAAASGGAMSDGSEVVSGMEALDEETEAVSVMGTGVDLVKQTEDYLQEQAERQDTLAGATEDMSDELCPDGGSSEFRTDDTEGTWEYTFSDCKDKVLDTLLNGGMEVAFESDEDTSDGYDWKISYEHFSVAAADGDPRFGADGGFRFIAGNFTDEYGTMPHGPVTGRSADLIFVANLEMVDHVNDHQTKMENAELWFEGVDWKTGDEQDTVYFALHGTGSDDSSNTYESCRDDLGCVKVDHAETTTFELDTQNDYYPSGGKLKVLGAGDSFVLLDASDGADDEVGVETQDGDLGTKKWSEITDRELGSLLGN